GAGFNGTSTKINISPIVSGFVNISVAAWIKTSATGDQVVVGQRDLDPANGQWFVDIHLNKVEWFSQGGGNSMQMSGNTSVNDGNWHEIAVVQSGTQLSFYVDGALDLAT